MWNLVEIEAILYNNITYIIVLDIYVMYMCIHPQPNQYILILHK